MRLRGHRTQDLDRWRKASRRELKRPRVAARRRYVQALRDAVFGPGHPYARGLLDDASLGRIDGDALVSFRREHQVASNATLILVGQFDPALMKQHIVYNFGHLSEDPPAPAAIPPAAAHPTPVFVAGPHDDAASPVVTLDARFAAPPGVGADHAAHLIAARILNARLLSLREDRALTYGIQADYEPRRGPGLWSIEGEADAARAREAAAALRAILDQLHADPRAIAADFVLARRELVNELLVESADPRAVLGQLAFIAEHQLAPDFYAQLIERLANATIAQVARVIEQELDPRAAVFGAFGPDAATRAALTGFGQGR